MNNEKFKMEGEKQCIVTTKTVERAYATYLRVPQIRITGRWLEAVGFPIGKKIKILFERDKIVLRPDSQTDSSNNR